MWKFSKKSDSAERWRFFDGPPWFVVPDSRLKKKYNSPTFLFFLWCYALLDRILTPQGRMFGAVYLAIAMYSMILSRSPAVILFFVLTSVLVFDFLPMLLFFPSIRFSRKLPLRVSCGSEFQVTYTIFNRSILPCFDLTADTTLHLKDLNCTDTSIPRLTLMPKQEGRIIRNFQLLKRGVYNLPSPLIETGFPFQLLKLSRTVTTHQQIICHPAYAQLASLKLPDGSAKNNDSVNSISSIGESMDFYGCREFRTGDDPRKIHWVASAKRGQFVVKEFQEEKLSRAALIMDNSLAAQKEPLKAILKRIFFLKPLKLRFNDEPFEAAVSLSASIATSLSSHDFVVDLFAAGSEIHHIRTGRHHMTQEAFLDLLSSLEPTQTKERFNKITPADIATIAASGAVFLILLSIDEESEKLYKRLVNTGAPVRVFLITSSPAPAWVETIRAEDILNGKAGAL